MAVLLLSKPISKNAVRLAVEVINTRLKTLETVQAEYELVFDEEKFVV